MRNTKGPPLHVDLRARNEVTALSRERTILRMRKETRRRRWPYQEFNELLDRKSIEAGIPLTAKGRPNSTVFEEITGVTPGRRHYWREGYNQPTTDSLRQVAEGLAPHTGDDPIELEHQLSVAAGRRSLRRTKPSDTPASLEGKIRRAKRILESESLTDEERDRYTALLAGYNRAYEGMLDYLIQELERDIQDSRDRR